MTSSMAQMAAAEYYLESQGSGLPRRPLRPRGRRRHRGQALSPRGQQGSRRRLTDPEPSGTADGRSL